MFDWLFRRKSTPSRITSSKPRTSRRQPRFPYPIETANGTEALTVYERMKREGKGTPVILGDDEALQRLAEHLTSEYARESVESILKAAERRPFPTALRAELAAARAKYDDLEVPEIETGDWPETGDEPSPAVGQTTLVSSNDILTGKPLERVHIALLPTDDSTQIPAFLRFGGWNACPDPATQVAAARYWRESYGAEIVAVTSDVVEYRTTRRPMTRDQAMVLAREHFDFCDDIVLQGTGSLDELAASLMMSDWWFFWWD